LDRQRPPQGASACCELSVLPNAQIPDLPLFHTSDTRPDPHAAVMSYTISLSEYILMLDTLLQQVAQGRLSCIRSPRQIIQPSLCLRDRSLLTHALLFGHARQIVRANCSRGRLEFTVVDPLLPVPICAKMLVLANLLAHAFVSRCSCLSGEQMHYDRMPRDRGDSSENAGNSNQSR
jgi:hypothetical protein